MVSDLSIPLVEMRRVSRHFGQITALSEIDFAVYPGQVVALLGDNGAGKSTLIKILTGVHPPSEGRLFFAGRPVHLDSPHAGRELGIETVYQDLALVPLMSIGRNFFLGRELTRRLGPFQILDKAAMDLQVTRALSAIGIHIRNPDASVETLSGGERQSIAIGRAIHFGTRLLILDEPTSSLSIGETRKVLGYIQEAGARGLAVIFITHNIHHVFAVAERLTILRRGRKVGDFARDDLTPDEAAKMIMGGNVPDPLHREVDEGQKPRGS